MKNQNRENKLPQKSKKNSYVFYALLYGCIILLFSFLLFLFFPGIFLNRYVQKQIEKKFNTSVQGYSLKMDGTHLNLWKSSLSCDSLTIRSKDSKFICKLDGPGVKGVKWLKLLGHKKSVTRILSGAEAIINHGVLNFFDTRYFIDFQRLHASVPDSTITLEKFIFHPMVDDEKLFSMSDYRRTRYRISTSGFRIKFSPRLDEWAGKIYHIYSVQAEKPFFDFLVNRDKPKEKKTQSPLMPNQMLAQIKGSLRIDSLNFRDGKFLYGERFAIRAKPGIILFNHIQLTGEKIMNNCPAGDTSNVSVRSVFMDQGNMILRIHFLPCSHSFSMIYSGSLSSMNLDKLNKYLEIAEKKRIKSGQLQEARFTIRLQDELSSGTVRAFYQGLKIASIDSLGNEGGIKKKVSTFLSNLKIHDDNKPDKERIGKVDYNRKTEDSFIKFMWYSLRDGTKDIMGL